MSNSHSVRQCVAQFELGRRLVTRGARDQLFGQSIVDCFTRHERGDFGDLCPEDFDANLDAIADGERVLSVYRCHDRQGAKATVFVITEADRTVTTLLLADEY